MKRDLLQCGYPDPVSGLDLSFVVTSQNDASIERSGQRHGEPCHKVHFGLDEPCAGCQREWVLKTGQPSRWYHAVREPGENEPRAYFEITLVPIRDDEGRVDGFFEFLRDATISFVMEHQLMATSEELDRKVLERTEQLERLKADQASLVQAEKMASLGRLVAGLTHEIHTPLGTIVSSLEMTSGLVARLEREPERAGEIAAQIAQLLELEDLASQRIGRLLRSLREFAHLDRAVEEATDLHVGINACLALLSHELKDRIDVELDFGELPLVVCRPDAMNQVFMNLLQNAVQAIEDRGTIRIRTRLADPDHVRLEFHDDGKGIPAENIERIFDPGFTTKPRGVGTGLGLALTINTVTLHHGTIDVESAVGEGTTFQLFLPVRGTEL